MTHSTHRVSCKVALNNPERTKVLLVEYGEKEYGLPGGHMEDFDQSPEAAMKRELKEELGIEIDHLQKKDFFRHVDGHRIILGFYGELNPSKKIKHQNKRDSVGQVD